MNRDTIDRLAKAYARLDRQKSKFDREAGARARDRSIEQVEDAADPVWKRSALEAIVWVAERRAMFTMDAVWWVLGYAETTNPREPRALGAIVRIAHVAVGLIEPTDRFLPTVRTSRHRAPLRVWESKIYDGRHDNEERPTIPY